MILGQLVRKFKAIWHQAYKRFNTKFYDAIILAVAHNNFKDMGSEFINKLGKKII